MKKLFFTICFLFILKLSFAQLESRYDFGNAPPLLQECNEFGKPTGKTFAPPAGASFRITNMYNPDTAIGTCLLYGEVKNDEIKFKDETAFSNYLKYNSISFDEVKVRGLVNTDLESKDKKGKSIKLNDVEMHRSYFLIKVSDLTKFSTPFYQTWKKNKNFVVGVQTKLIKIRLKEFDFAKDFSLASTFGIRYRTSPKKDNFLNFVGTIGVSLNDLDNNVATKLSDTSKIKNIGALTVGIGVIREYGKIQFSLMFGKDYLSKANQNKYNWIYNGKTWVSFGVGVGIFTGDDGKKGSETDKQSSND